MVDNTYTSNEGGSTGGLVSTGGSGTVSSGVTNEEILRKKAECEARGPGWKWNPKTNTCDKVETLKVETPETFSSTDTGRASGVVTPGTGKYQIPDPNKPGFSKPATLEEYNAYRASIGLGPTAEGATFLGLSPDDVQQVVTGEQQRVARPEGTAPVGFAQQQLLAEQQQQQLLETETPSLVELNPDMEGYETPILGSILRGITPVWEGFFGEGSVPNKQELLKFATNEIQRKEIEKGLTWSERIGALIEGVPGGAKVTNLLNIETPRGNLEEVIQDIKSQRRRVSSIESNVRSGYLPIETAQEQIEDIEQYISKQEARLRLLINNSPSLNFNSDRVNSFETDILTVKEKILQAKLNIQAGAIEQPDELDLYLKMQQQDEPDWATSEY